MNENPYPARAGKKTPLLDAMVAYARGQMSRSDLRDYLLQFPYTPRTMGTVEPYTDEWWEEQKAESLDPTTFDEVVRGHFHGLIDDSLFEEVSAQTARGNKSATTR